MAMLHSSNGKVVLSRLDHFLTTKKSNWCSREVGNSAWFSSSAGELDLSNWKRLHTRILGISSSKISPSSLKIIRVLQCAGYEAYFVGGCVRDLVLQRVPKDFDIITTAGLKQIKRMFKRALIVGQRFPICRVYLRGSFVEVSSFETSSQNYIRGEFSFPKMPKGCDPRDFFRWKNCMKRDFTVNSLFFDPLRSVVFDYVDALKDLRSMELRTIMPAHLSFQEDEARILRGLRLAARLNMSLSKEVGEAIYSLSSSVVNLSKSRIALEMNYMLSYGAAESSILLLEKFKVLEILLPFQAAYCSEQSSNGLDLRSTMLLKLFSNMDQLVSCDQPAHESLWVAIFAFHKALFSNPRHPLVVLTFASLLYHGTWSESINFARKNFLNTVICVPEIIQTSNYLSDECLADEVSQLARQVEDSVNVLVSTDYLSREMRRFSKVSCLLSAFVSQKMAQRTQHIFVVLANDVLSLKLDRISPQISNNLLAEGDTGEIRFVLGKIILETLVDRSISVSFEGREQVHVQVINVLKALDVKKNKTISFVDTKVKDSPDHRQPPDDFEKGQSKRKTTSFVDTKVKDSPEQRQPPDDLEKGQSKCKTISFVDTKVKDSREQRQPPDDLEKRQSKRKTICFVDTKVKDSHEQRKPPDDLEKGQSKTSFSPLDEVKDSLEKRLSPSHFELSHGNAGKLNPPSSRNKKTVTTKNHRNKLMDDTNKDVPSENRSTPKLSSLFR